MRCEGRAENREVKKLRVKRRRRKIREKEKGDHPEIQREM